MKVSSVVDKREVSHINDWDKWVAWIKERQEAIDKAKTPKEKAAVAALYKRSYKGRM